MDTSHTESDTQKQASSSQYMEPPVQFRPTAGFCAWLEKMNASLTFTSAKANKLVIIGQKEQRLKIFTRTIENIRAVFARQDRLCIAAGNAIWTYVDITAKGMIGNDCDALYSPRHLYITGPVDVHDIYLPQDPVRPPVFANTQFSCVAKTDEIYNFRPLWVPPFISALVPEDRCHLSGVAIDPDTESPRYVTVAAQTDRYEAWQLHRASRGAVLDVETGEIVLDGLSCPHAPRIYQGSLYILDTGGGRLVRLTENNSSEEICNFPGLVKGLCFIDDYAIVSVSSFAHKASVEDLPFYERMQSNDEEKQCAVHVVDLKKKELVHSLYITGALKEIDSVSIINGRQNPAILRQEAEALSKLYYLPEFPISASEHIVPNTPARRSLKVLEEDFLIERYTDFSIIGVWGNVTPQIKDALIEFWLENKILPRQEDLQIRAAQACFLALNKDGEIIAEMTVYEDTLGSILPDNSKKNEERIQDKYYFVRALTAPDYARFNVTAKMGLHCYEFLKAEAKQGSNKPKGMMIIAENEKLARPLILKRFKRHGFEVLPIKTQEGRAIIRKCF